MDTSTLLACLGGAGALLGGFWGVVSGRLQGIAGANQLLQSKLDELKDDNKAKDALIMDLKEQVKTLTELVTSKADVETVKVQLDKVQKTLDLIAERVGVASA